jgi:hypothetical protein
VSPPGERVCSLSSKHYGDHTPDGDLTRLESGFTASTRNGPQIVRGLVLDQFAAREGDAEHLAGKLGPEIRIDA